MPQNCYLEMYLFLKCTHLLEMIRLRSLHNGAACSHDLMKRLNLLLEIIDLCVFQRTSVFHKGDVYMIILSFVF